MAKQIPELDIIATPTAGQESIIETVVARHDTYETSRMTLAQIFTLGSISGSIKVALDALTTAIWANTTAITTKLNTIGWTRTGLTANRAIYTNGSWVESFLTGWTTEFIWFDGSWMPIAKVPDGRITWEVRMWSTPAAPTNWLICDGTAISRTTYASLFNVLVPNKWAITISIATPWVVSLTAHGLNIGDSFYITTTWALPTGLAINTLYYVISAWFWANSFQLSATRGWSAINTSGTQSWVHSLFLCAYWLGNGTTTFNVPNMKWRASVGLDTSQTEFSSLWQTWGAKTHTLTSSESWLPAHVHWMNTGTNTSWATSWFTGWRNDLWGVISQIDTLSTGWTSAASAHNNLQPYFTINYIIAI